MTKNIKRLSSSGELSTGKRPSVNDDSENGRRVYQRHFQRLFGSSEEVVFLAQPNSFGRLVEMILDFVKRSALRRSFPAYQQKKYFIGVWNGSLGLFKESAAIRSSWREALDASEGIGQVPQMTSHESKEPGFHISILCRLAINLGGV